MNEFFQTALTKVKENKAVLIKVGSAVAGALLGATIAGMLTSDESVDGPFLEDEDLTEE